MAKVPAVGDVQKMITFASMGAMVCITGAVFSAVLIALEYIKPGYLGNPIAGAIFGALLLLAAAFFLKMHKESPRRKRTVMNVMQNDDGKAHMTVQYMDGKTETIPADGTR